MLVQGLVLSGLPKFSGWVRGGAQGFVPWSGLSRCVRPAGVTHRSLAKRGKVFPEEFQLLQAFAKEILNWIRFIIPIC